jgi:hypothetical protein
MHHGAVHDMQSYTEAMKHIDEGFADDFKQILADGALGAYEATLIEALKEPQPNISMLFRYGLDRLPDDASRPDRALATYFLCLSEIKNADADMRDLAMDAMVYCENDDDTLVIRNAMQLRARYQELFPSEPKNSI